MSCTEKLHASYCAGHFYNQKILFLVYFCYDMGMAHINEKIDFTVEAFVVHNQRVLLIFHKKLQRWLPLGGHIELDEDPEQALFREVKEESGLGRCFVWLYSGPILVEAHLWREVVSL